MINKENLPEFPEDFSNDWESLIRQCWHQPCSINTIRCWCDNNPSECWCNINMNQIEKSLYVMLENQKQYNGIQI